MNDREKLWVACARAVHDATPPVDVARGRQLLLEAQRSLAPRARTRLRWRICLAAASVATMLAIVRFVWLRPLTFECAGAEAGAWLATDGTAELPLRFSEGTVVVLAPDSRGRVDELRTRGARVVLERGTLRAQVTHRLRSDWRFVAGPFEVAVTGTALEVGWDPVRERFSTAVTSGAVKVMGPSVGSEVTVREGERCDVDLARHTMQLSRLSQPATAALPELVAPAPGPTAPAAPAPVPAIRLVPPKHTRAPAPAVRWTILEEAGRYDEALAAVDRAGVDATIAAANDDELLRLARLARAAGDTAVATRALMACRHSFAHTASAGVAAYELGRAASPSAARWFAVYLEEQPDGPLAEQASGRLFEALELAGRHADAVAAARRSLARFPNGPYASMARRLIDSPPK